MKKIMNRILIMLLFVLSGCGAAQSVEKDAANQNKMMQIEDTNGTIQVPEDPQRIVVFDMGMLDTIDELGLGDRVVGVPKESLPDYLNQYDTKEIGSVGTLKEPDFESIFALEPDMIFISGRQQAALNSLSEIAPTVFFTLDYTDYWASFEEQVNAIGSIFLKEDEVEEELADLRTSVDELTEQVSSLERSTLTVLLNEGNLSAYGAGSRFGILNDTFSLQSTDPTIEASTHGQSVSYEYVLNQNPDVLFVIDRTTAIGGDTSNNNLMNNPLIQETSAYQSDQIVYLNPDIWYLSGGGLQSMERMIEEVRSAMNE